MKTIFLKKKNCLEPVPNAYIHIYSYQGSLCFLQSYKPFLSVEFLAWNNTGV